MKKLLILGLIIVGIAAHGADGEDSTMVETTATVLSDIEVTPGGDIGEFTDPDGPSGPEEGVGSGIEGDKLALGTMFRGDTKDTWTTINNDVHPALITIASVETDADLVTKTASAHINYKVPPKVTINGGGDQLEVDLYVSTDGAMGTPATGSYENAQFTNGEYKFLIHGVTTAKDTQAIANYTANFEVFGRYDRVANGW